MSVKLVTISGLVGTSVMTAISYALSKKFRKNFKEPDHLNSLIKKWKPELPDTYTQAGAWAFHYSMGEAWAVAYLIWLKLFHKKPTFYNLMIFGAIGGIAGIISWKGLFKLGSNSKSHTGFYLQLILSHFIFSIVLGDTYSLLEKIEHH